jgi:hypothetical protein
VVGLIQLFECLRIERRGHHAFSCDAVRRRPLTDYPLPHQRMRSVSHWEMGLSVTPKGETPMAR